MTVLLQLTIAAADTGPFELYSNMDGFTTAFETDIPKSVLVAGFSFTSVPDNAIVIRVKSLGTCTNYTDIVLTSAGPTTTSTSTTVVGTTTTTTTLIFLHNLSVGEFVVADSCAHTTYPLAVSANTNPITIGTTIRNYPSGTIFLGNSLYYRLQGPGSSIRILADGKVTFGGSNCL